MSQIESEDSKLNTRALIFKKFINIKNIIFFTITTILIIYFLSFYINLNLKSLSIDKLLSYQDNLFKSFNKNINITNYTSLSITSTTNTIVNNNINECDPIDRSYKQYYVTIDGEQYPKSVPTYLNYSINFKCLNESKNIKRILYWNTFFSNNGFGFGLGKQIPFINNLCPVTTCETTNDKSLLNQSDLVLIHMRDSADQIPSYRPVNQRWVFSLYESPIHSGDFSRYNGLFNLTSTYRIDSDFPHFYEGDMKYKWKLNTSFNDSFDFYNGRSEFAAAVISNCGARNKRLDYIKELQKYVKVNVFGGCGQSCPTKYKNTDINADCKEIIAKEYKFYLAFENSFCEGYITEKFFITLKYDIIPVVMGLGKYEHYIPKSGFINTRDFSSPKDLADYLLYLDRNRTAYNSYFKWKKHVTRVNDFINFNPICNMCIKLHLESFEGIKKNVINDIQSYWHANTCKSLNSIFDKI